MTVTKVEKSQADEVYAIGKQKQNLIREIFDEDQLVEMKFEMKSIKNPLPKSTANITATNNEINNSTGRRRDMTQLPQTACTRNLSKSLSLDEMTRSRSITDFVLNTAKRDSFGGLRNAETYDTGSSRHSLDIKSQLSQDSLESILPERTRLRRQRRMLSQESVDEKPEDAIERLNKLKARISGALSEIKGVLKQYSAESEAETAKELNVDKLTVPRLVRSSAVKTEDNEVAKQNERSLKNATEPVQFRFVRRVQRKSIFNEEDEYETRTEKTPKKLQTEQQETDEPTLKKDNTTTTTAELAIEDSKLKAKLQFLTRVEYELNKKPEPQPNPVVKESVNDVIAINKNSDVATIKEEQSIEVECREAFKPPYAIEEPKLETVKTKEILCEMVASRRASIAAVEESKIAPAIQANISLAIKEKRRPSDSEATVKKNRMSQIIIVKTTSDNNTKEQPLALPKTKVKSATSKSGTAAKAPTIDSIKNLQIHQEFNDVKLKERIEHATSIASVPSASLATIILPPIVDTNATINGAKLLPKQLEINAVDCNASIVAAINDNDVAIAAVNTAKCKDAVQQTLAAASVSPLSDSKLNSHTNDPPSDILAELAAEKITVVAPVNNIKQNNKRNEPTATEESEIKKRLNHIEITNHTIHNNIEQQVAISADIGVCEIADAANAVAIASKNDESDRAQPQTTATAAVTAQSDVQLKANITTDNTNTVVILTSQSTNKKMPELQVPIGSVQPVKISGTEEQTTEAVTFDVPVQNNHDEFSVKKQVPLERLVRKNSIDKSASEVAANQKANALFRDEKKITNLADNLKINIEQTATEVVTQPELVKAAETELEASRIENITKATTRTVEGEKQNEEARVIKSTRKIKRKVIIKRQKRRLSESDSFFTQAEVEPQVDGIETIEKAIAYVTDDEEHEEQQETVDTAVTDKPSRSCMHVREYKVGDEIMYAERYKKTLVRWKRGRVLGRITSISYNLDIEGKEVPAHISYMKKYTGRKVRFGDKEYLEIDYEQVAEEERRARSYSIWNIV